MAEIVLTDDEAQAIAKNLVDALFALGSGLGQTPVQRIQFMGGIWPDNEIGQGGMCHQALMDFIKKFLLARAGEQEAHNGQG